MDNSELRELLADLAKDDPRPRLAGVLEIRAANYLREHGARLLADSEAYAKLRAEIAGLADELEPLGKDSGIAEWATGFAACANETTRRLRALLRLPAGEGE